MESSSKAPRRTIIQSRVEVVKAAGVGPLDPRPAAGLESGASPGQAERPEVAVIQIKRILVPTDFSESAQHALTYGVSFAREYKAELILVHVVESLTVGYASDLFPVPMAEVFDEISGYAKTEIAKLAAAIRPKEIAVREMVLQGKPSAEITRIAKEESVDIIVLGTHGKGMLDQALFGSTAERVIRKAPCPVLTCQLHQHEFCE
jgi:nucleotide-binding universal stress UspA family protein